MLCTVMLKEAWFEIGTNTNSVLKQQSVPNYSLFT